MEHICDWNIGGLKGLKGCLGFFATWVLSEHGLGPKVIHTMYV